MREDQSHKEWDNRILEFDGEDYVCIGRVVRNTFKSKAYVIYELSKASVVATTVNDEIWVPLARAYFALEALKGNPMFCQINLAGDWSVDAPVPDDKDNLRIGQDDPNPPDSGQACE